MPNHHRYRYVMKLSYLGTNYSGWQIQNNAKSIQGSIMDALHTILNKNISLMVGSGRTDAGVHAVNFFAHFDYEKIHIKNVSQKKQKNTICCTRTLGGAPFKKFQICFAKHFVL